MTHRTGSIYERQTKTQSNDQNGVTSSMEFSGQTGLYSIGFAVLPFIQLRRSDNEALGIFMISIERLVGTYAADSSSTLKLPVMVAVMSYCTTSLVWKTC
jgi:hypothetical protein